MVLIRCIEMNASKDKNQVTGKFPGGHKWVLRRIRINYKPTNNQNSEAKYNGKQERQQSS
jgi:hypothetical protein